MTVGAKIIAANRRTWDAHTAAKAGTRPGGSTADCPYCSHPLHDHHLFPGNYEDPGPEVSCSDKVHPLVGCICYGPPDHWTPEQLAAIDLRNRA